MQIDNTINKVTYVNKGLDKLIDLANMGSNVKPTVNVNASYLLSVWSMHFDFSVRLDHCIHGLKNIKYDNVSTLTTSFVTFTWSGQ